MCLERPAGRDKHEYKNNISSDIATATTAACGGYREELLGPRPAGCKHRSRCEADAGSRNPSQSEAETILNRKRGRIHELRTGTGIHPCGAVGRPQARPDPHPHPAGGAGRSPGPAEICPCGRHQRQGQHRCHAGVLPARRRVPGGAVHVALHQPLQRAYSGGRRADPGRRAGAASGAGKARRRCHGRRAHRVRDHHRAGDAVLCPEKLRCCGAGSGPGRHAGFHQRH